MKSDHAFVAERAAAQHCAALIRRGPDAAELLPLLADFAQRLARALGPALAPLTGGVVPEVLAGPPVQGELPPDGQQLTAHCLFAAGVVESPLLMSVDGGAVLGMLDRAFGGRGEAPSVLPDQFPHSAELMLGRIAELLAAQLAEALPCSPAVRPLRNSSDRTQLAPFPAGERIVSIEFTVMTDAAAQWQMRLALSEQATPALLGTGRSARHSRAPRAADPAAEPFAGLELPLSAVLVDMALPIGTVSALRTGQVLPIAVARAVPLRIGARIIAYGAVGQQDERVALQITQLV